MSDVVVFLGSLSQAQLGDTVTLTLTNDGKVIYKQQQTSYAFPDLRWVLLNRLDIGNKCSEARL